MQGRATEGEITMSTDFKLQTIINKIITHSEEAIELLKENNEFLNQSMRQITDVIQDETLIKSIYSDQVHYENVKQYLEDIKLVAKTLNLANGVGINDYTKLKSIIKTHRLSNEELLKLQKQAQINLDSTLSSIENYRQIYQEAVERVPFLELNEKIIPFS